MSEENKFREGDLVRWGTAEGTVTGIGENHVEVDFSGDPIRFFPAGTIFSHIKGQPLLELIERPQKKKKKITLYKWERGPVLGGDGIWYLVSSGWQDQCPGEGWEIVPGSGRDFVIEAGEEEGHGRR